MTKELDQLLRRRRLSSFGKRHSIIEGAGGGGAEHQVAGESLAAMQTASAGVCFSHLTRGGCCGSSMTLLVEADLFSLAT